MKILVKDAQIKTVSVDIKALTINGKQMTLAVYRQLDQLEPSLDTDIVWGRVNYCNKECPVILPTFRHEKKYPIEHMHFVWQRENSLYRWTLEKPNKWDDHTRWNELQKAQLLFIAV